MKAQKTAGKARVRRMSLRLRGVLGERVDAYMERTGVSFQQMATRALDEYLRRQKA